MEYNVEHIKQEVQALFATPIYFSQLERNFSNEELQFIENSKKDCVVNINKNKTSSNQYVLEEKEMINLKQELMLRLDQYFKLVEESEDDVKLYITQSWINFNEPNTSHHEHMHPNSFLSGVLYINAVENLDFIRFLHPRDPLFQFENKKKFNIFNSGVWDFPVKTKQILLFPSYLKHCVLENFSNHERISLSFNVFFKGKIGNYATSSELKIGETNGR